MRTLIQAFRSLLRMRLTAGAVLVTLAGSIAANLMVFALVNAALIRPLPFDEPRRLVAMDDELNGKPTGISWGEIQQLERAPSLFESAAAFTKRTWALTDHSGQGMDVVLSGMVTPNFFRVLGATPLAGSIFDTHEGATGDERVAMLSYSLWQERYRGDASVLSQTLALNDVQYKIVGVLPKSFSFSIDGQTPDIYIPLDRKDYCCQHSQRGLEGVARLAPGVPASAANEHLQALAQITAQAEGLQRLSYQAVPLQTYLARDEQKTLLLLWLSVLALGMIASLNAGALLLARSLRNLRQYAVKISLGATVGRLLQEQIALAAVLSSIAGATGLGLSILGLRLLQFSPLFAPFLGSVKNAETVWDWRVLCFCGALSFASAVTACALPLALLRGLPVQQVMRTHAGLSSSRRGRSIRTALIVAQLGLSVMLFSVVSSFGHSLYALLNRDPGFKTKNVVMAGIGVPEARYDTDAKMIGFHHQVLESIENIPGVRNAGFAAGAPLHPLRTSFLLDGTALPMPERPRVAIAMVSPQMFQILGVPIVRGRGFSAADRERAPLVAIVNQAFARAYLSKGDPFGRGMQIQFYNGVSMKPWSHFGVIGIAADSRNRSIDRDPEPEIYLSTEQIPLEGGSYFLDTERDASSLKTELPAAVWRVDAQIQRVEPVAVQLFIEQGFDDKRALVYLSLSFAVMALFLAALGLGSSISAGVSEGTKEIGIRSALGESRLSVATRILRGSIGRTLLGTACGMAGSVALSRIATISIDPQMNFDLWVLAPVAALMLMIAAVVSIFPVRRALGISPVEALRAE
jgi:predicted permease